MQVEYRPIETLIPYAKSTLKNGTKEAVCADCGTISVVRKDTKPVVCKRCASVPASGKHKYLMSLDKDMKEQIKHLSKPYPKRGKQAMSPDQGDSGGAAPTTTLHEEVCQG